LLFGGIDGFVQNFGGGVDESLDSGVKLSA
jgi:hypothetical protein